MSTAILLGPGSVVGGEFTIRAPLEEGGMGAVYVAEQRSTGKLRALKLMHREIVADAALKKRFEQEARVASRIRSEHVVEVLAAGVDEASGLPYLVMELLEGKDLRHHVDAVGSLPHQEIRAIYEQLCHAMAAAHEGGVVHRDLKPENVFLARSLRAGGAPFTVKVLDFGIAKIEAEAGTRATKGAVGSPLWMAPEQTAPGPVTPAADVWALGLLAYELFTGKSFWRAANHDGGTTAQLLREIVLDPIPPASARAREQDKEHLLPAGFDEWFAKCVEREPEQRYAEAGALWSAMLPLFEGAPSRVTTREAMAETFAAPRENATSAPVLRASETGDATAFQAASIGNARSAPPAPEEPAPRSSARKLPAETPLESVREPRPAAPPAGRGAIVVGGVIALLGIGAGVVLSRADRATHVELTSSPAAPSVSAPAPALAAPSVSAPASAAVSASASASAPASAAVSASPPPVPASAAPRASASAAPPRKTLPGGFSDPSDRAGAVTWKVQDRHVRLFTRLVSNESNVTDAVVRKAVEWSSWEYLRCYERAFAAAKDLPEGSVSVGFDILDQLPRHATLVSSTIESATFNDCVVRTLVGQTINAAGPDGKGHVVHAFRFVPN
ncbi:MAG TPA: serine/threonine-protein kinase [Labilithrix sp.]|nr:serine/threonine-protein kinase [Labilithrix sp.]